ncbi:hypothetical protein COY95_04430 [Candidatus Woesearchaeota archaeon CG_4_10_14_0_8_um_filter_47_5]|nr:MAG: hypothetical protein COY95_04430 [Candidatus Woesearchaeota archaeon CG_4_10_14_0_8_um_filter_47_5]
MGVEVNITYETLFEFLRREKGRAEIQELEDTFYEDVVSYIKDKETIVATSQTTEERTRNQIQLDNTKKIFADLYAKRETKIIELALIEVKTHAPISTAALLAEERHLFQRLVDDLKQVRESVLQRIIAARLPQLYAQSPHPSFSHPSSGTEAEESASFGEPITYVFVRFLTDVPRFLGEDLEVHGPFKEGDMASIPADIARVLIARDHAKEIEKQPL